MLVGTSNRKQLASRTAPTSISCTGVRWATCTWYSRQRVNATACSSDHVPSHQRYAVRAGIGRRPRTERFIQRVLEQRANGAESGHDKGDDARAREGRGGSVAGSTIES